MEFGFLLVYSIFLPVTSRTPLITFFGCRFTKDALYYLMKLKWCVCVGGGIAPIPPRMRTPLLVRHEIAGGRGGRGCRGYSPLAYASSTHT